MSETFFVFSTDNEEEAAFAILLMTYLLLWTYGPELEISFEVIPSPIT